MLRSNPRLLRRCGGAPVATVRGVSVPAGMLKKAICIAQNSEDQRQSKREKEEGEEEGDAVVVEEEMRTTVRTRR